MIAYWLAFVLIFSACLGARASDGTSDLLARYDQFIAAKDFTSAWNLLEHWQGKKDANFHLGRGFHLFSGYGVEADKCRATLEFEEARRLGSAYTLTYLQYIYNGAWMQIAAEEGNPDALFDLAEASWAAYKVGNVMAAHSKRLALQDIYRLYKRAEIAGHPKARGQTLILSYEIRREGGELPAVEADFKRVICDVRGRR